MGSAAWIGHAQPATRTAARPFTARDLLLGKGVAKPTRPGFRPLVDLRRIDPHTLVPFSPNDPRAASLKTAAAVSARAWNAPQVNAPNTPPPAPPPYIDLTTFPRPPFIGPSTASHDL